MKRSITVFSDKKSQEELLKELCEQIKEVGSAPSLIIFFAEHDYFWYIATNIKKQFPTAITMGTTSYFHFNDKGSSYSGASAMAIFSGIECAEGILFEINRHPSNYIQHIRNAVGSLSTCDNTCCLEFCTAFSNGEELLMDTFEEGFEGQPITVFGSSAGVRNGTETMVSLNGEVYQNSCVFCLIHNMEGRIYYYKENIFKPTNNYFKTTDVDCDERVIYALDDKPTADVLADVLGVSLEQLPEVMRMNPLGRIVDDEVYITAENEIYPDGAISYFCRLYNRAKVVMLELDDIEEVWKKTTESVQKKIETPSFCFMVSCCRRTDLFERKKMLNSFTNMLKENYNNYLGVSGYGEQLNYQHFNQTMIIAVFE